MKIRLLDFLVCPIDLTPLKLIEWESVPVSLSDEHITCLKERSLNHELYSREVVQGVLINCDRKIFYPIYHGIPRMLVFPTGLTREFCQEYAEEIEQTIPGYTLPQEQPPPGEENVLRTFSNEWTNYDWNPNAYWSQTADAVFKTMDFLLDLERKPVKDKYVLEVGIGIGGIADHVVRSQQAELVGFDLGYAVDAAFKNFGANPFMHIVQASVFSPPFAAQTFDLVYSQGVIHHTYSTKAAFDSISNLPKKGGRLYIWVYSYFDEQRNFQRRILMSLENLFRPIISRLPNRLQTLALMPAVPFYILNQHRRVKRRRVELVDYGWREAIHAARDRLTPPYAHRHTESEVRNWFDGAGYTDIQAISERKHPSFIEASYVSCTAVDGARRAVE